MKPEDKPSSSLIENQREVQLGSQAPGNVRESDLIV